MKNLIVSVLFTLVSVFGFSQNEYVDTTVYSLDPLSVRIVPFKVNKNGKPKELNQHYIFQVSHNFIYCIGRNHNIKYTMEITKMSTVGDKIDIIAKRFNGKQSEIYFSVPLTENTNFLVVDGKNNDRYSKYTVEVTTEYDLYNKKGH